MIRFLYLGSLWVALVWSVSLALGCWAHGDHPEPLIYAGLATALIGILWTGRRTS